MSFPAFSRRQARSTVSSPIKSYSRRGFIIGWIAIMGFAAGAYALGASKLNPSSAQLHLVSAAGQTQYVLAPV